MERKKLPKLVSSDFFFCIGSFLSKVIMALLSYMRVSIRTTYSHACTLARAHTCTHTHACTHATFYINLAIDKTPKKTSKNIELFPAVFMDYAASRKIAQTCPRKLNADSTRPWSEIVRLTLPGPLATGKSQDVLGQAGSGCGRSLFIMNST